MSDLLPIPPIHANIIPIDPTATIALIQSQYTTLISSVVTPAKSLSITNPSSFTDADTHLGKLQSTRKQITAKLDEEIRPKYEELEKWYSLKRELLSDLDAAEKYVKLQMATYKLEEQKRIEEAERIRLEATKALSQQAQVEVAKVNDTTLSALDRARAKFKAKQKVEESQQVVQQTTIIPVKGTSSKFTPTETWEVTDMRLFLQGILDGKIPIETVMVQVVNVNAFWKINKGTVKGWPGVEVKTGGRITGR